MTNTERTEQRIKFLTERFEDDSLEGVVFEALAGVSLMDIMRSLASIADSLEIIATRKEDQNEDSVQG